MLFLTLTQRLNLVAVAFCASRLIAKLTLYFIDQRAEILEKMWEALKDIRERHGILDISEMSSEAREKYSKSYIISFCVHSRPTLSLQPIPSSTL
jgi:hypothetical protein